VILSDDQEAETIRYMPNLNALIVDQGTTLENFLISMPLCCPSRATFLRGQYGHSTEIMGNDLPYGGFPRFDALGEESSTVATWLQEAGYRTMLAGKYLNAFPQEDDLMHIPPGWTEWFSPVDGDAYVQFNYVLNENGTQVEYGKDAADYGTDVYGQKTVEFIERSAAEGEPFFAYVSVYAPHWPYTAAPRHEGMFDGVQAPRTPNFDEEDVSDKPAHLRNLPPLSEAEIDQIDEAYRQRLRSLMAVDDLIADVVAALDATGQLDNTYIFYTSDNGFHLGCHRQVTGKTAPYDEETRVTMMVRGPGVPAGETLEHLTGNIDAAPTWAELAGVQPADFVDGRSLVPLLGGNPPPLDEWRQSFLLEHAPYEQPALTFVANMPAISKTPASLLEPPDADDMVVRSVLGLEEKKVNVPPYRGMRTEEYLYVEYPMGDRELYNLRVDPYHLENSYANADPALVEELAGRLEALAKCSAEECRRIEDQGFGATAGAQAAPTAAPAASPSAPRSPPSEPLIYYLGYATEENVPLIEAFDADVLSRGFLLFLNPGEAWLADYGPRLQALQQDSRQFLVALQAAVLVEDGADLPSLGAGDPALAYPMESIPQWEEYACRLPDGSTLKEGQHLSFAHACLNDPAFAEFLLARLEAIVDSGADGVHIDEWHTRYFAKQEGYCDDCMAGFRQYLQNKYAADQLRSLYQIDDVRAFDYRQRLVDEGNLASPPESPLHREWWLYQLSSLEEIEAEITAAVKAYAASQGKDFVVTANSFEPEQNPDRALEMSVTDFSSIGTGMTIRLRRGGKFATELRGPPAYSYLPLYRMAQGVKAGVPVALFIDGPGGTATMKALPEQEQADMVRWMFAEAYAAGARFHVPYPSLDYYAPQEPVEAYVQFLLDNREVYEDAEPVSEVGVVFSFASEIWDYWIAADSKTAIHNRQYYGLTQALGDMSVQYTTVFFPDGNVLADDLTLAKLQEHEVLLVPSAYALNGSQVARLEEYLASGGQLITLGDVATHDAENGPRAADVAAQLKAAGAILVPGLNFESYLASPQGEAGGAIREALGDLLPERQVGVSDDSVTVVLAITDDNVHCHLINKDRGDAGFVARSDVRVRIMLPQGQDLASDRATYASPDTPDGAPEELALVVEGGLVEVTVSHLEVYGVLSLPIVPR
jgi:arylsulfatase A-like enzyme